MDARRGAAAAQDDAQWEDVPSEEEDAVRQLLEQAAGQERDSDSEEGQDADSGWETSSSASLRSAQAGASDASDVWCPQAPTSGSSPLSNMPDEILLNITGQLSSQLYERPKKRHLASLYSLSSASQRFRAIVWPFLFRRVTLACRKQTPEALASFRRYCELLVRPDVSCHIRAVWINLPHYINTLPAIYYGEALQQLLAYVVPRLAVLVLENFHYDAKFLQLLARAEKLRILDVDDGFTGDPDHARQMTPASLSLKENRVYYCSISTEYKASSVPFALLQGMERVERLVVRAFKDRFNAGFFPINMWSHLRVLALDSGNAYNSGLISLFQQFQEYRQHTPCPLAEVYLEIREPVRDEFEQIIYSLKGHQPLKKLNLMVLPLITPAKLADMAAALPQLQELNLIALTSRMLVWRGEPLAYADALAAFPHLHTFGFNGVPDPTPLTGLQRQPPDAWAEMTSRSKTLKNLVIFHDFGDTEYFGRTLKVMPPTEEGPTRPHDSGEISSIAGFFPSRFQTLMPGRPAEDDPQLIAMREPVEEDEQ